MNYLLYVISVLLVTIWFVIFWSSNPFETIDFLPVMAGLLLIVGILFNKQISTRNKNVKNEEKSETTLN